MFSFLSTGLWAFVAAVALLLALPLFAASMLLVRPHPKLALLAGLSVIAFSAVIAWTGWLGVRARTVSPVLSDAQTCGSNDGGFSIPWREAEPIEVEWQTKTRQAAIVFVGAGSLALVLGVLATLSGMIGRRRVGTVSRHDVWALISATLLAMLGIAACLPYLRDPAAFAKSRVANNAIEMVRHVLPRQDCNPCPLIEEAAAYLGLPAVESNVPGVRIRAHTCVEARLQHIIENESEPPTCCSNPKLNAVSIYLQGVAQRTPGWKREQLADLAHSPLLTDEAQKARIEALRKE